MVDKRSCGLSGINPKGKEIENIAVDIEKLRLKHSIEDEEYVDYEIGKPRYQEIFNYLSKKVRPNPPSTAKIAYEKTSDQIRQFCSWRGNISGFRVLPYSRTQIFQSKLEKDGYLIPLKRQEQDLLLEAHVVQGVHLNLEQSTSNLYDMGFKYNRCKQKLQRLVADCHICRQNGPLPTQTKQWSTIQTQEPKELIQFDCVYLNKAFDPLQYTYSYLCTAVDHFSKYAWAFHISRVDAKETEACLQTVLRDCGRVQIVQTDKGNEFLGAFHHLLEHRNIRHKIVESSQQNGAVERFNRTIQNTLKRQYLEQPSHFDLDETLPRILEVYNSTVHGTIKRKPRDILHCRDASLLEKVICNRDRKKKRVNTVPQGSLNLCIGSQVLIYDDVEFDQTSMSFVIAEVKKGRKSAIPANYSSTGIIEGFAGDSYTVKVIASDHNRFSVNWVGQFSSEAIKQKTYNED